jgi:hypothetical protein
MVNIWTKSSEARCVTRRVVSDKGVVGYETIRGEGSSNGCRVYIVWASQIVRAEGYVIGKDKDKDEDEFISSLPL